MTTAHDVSALHCPPASPTGFASWRNAIVLATAIGIVGGLTLPQFIAGAAAPSVDAELTILLRFTAATKAMIAIAAIALAGWRLGYVAAPRIGLTYSIAAVLMAAAPGFIWTMTTVAEGAGLFHAGLALFLSACWLDRGDTRALLNARLIRSRSAR